MADLPTPNIIRSMRKTMSLHISSHGELIVKAPFFIPEKLIHHFIKQKKEWILKAIQKSKDRKVSKKNYLQDEEFLFLGDVYKLNIGDFKEISVAKGLLHFPNFMQFRIQKELTNWFLKQAKEKITDHVDYMSKKMKYSYKSLRFSDTSSKWGSCGPDNALQFNWRLIMTPLTVINYVVVHELTHTIEKNHGPSFWIKVRLYTPAYKQHRKWLETNKHLLNV